MGMMVEEILDAARALPLVTDNLKIPPYDNVKIPPP
jgi:hypothetical protein